MPGRSVLAVNLEAFAGAEGNTPDADVTRCLAMLTLLPADELRRLGELSTGQINEAKEILAASGVDIVPAASLDEAAEKVVELTG